MNTVELKLTSPEIKDPTWEVVVFYPIPPVGIKNCIPPGRGWGKSFCHTITYVCVCFYV
jgi:hypothetical protein